MDVISRTPDMVLVVLLVVLLVALLVVLLVVKANANATKVAKISWLRWGEVG